MGQFTFSDYARPPSVSNLTTRESLAVSFSRNSYASPRVFTSRTHFTGSVYGEDERLIPLSQRPSAAAWYQPSDPETMTFEPDGCGWQPGRTLYLGILHKHFGHFILESISRLWPLLWFDLPFDTYYFHPWQEDMALDAVMGQEFVRICLDCLKIPVDRVRLVPSPGVRFEQCTIPQQLFSINQHAHETFNSIVDKVAGSSGMDDRVLGNHAAARIYFSRANQDRRAANEDEIEQIFRQYGFSIVYPEQMSFPKQIAMVRNAEVMAGCDGSAMHLSLFAKSPTIICIDQRDVRNQLIIERLRGLRAYHVWALKEQIAPNRWVADITAIRNVVKSIL